VDATSVNVTARALNSTGAQLAGQVFFRSHLLEIVDRHLAPAPNNIPSSGVFHPGETLHIRGYFLENSGLGIVLRLTRLVDSSVVILGVDPCQSHTHQQFQAECRLPPVASFGSFGEFLVGLEEQGTGQLLSDDHSMLVILVLPVPVVLEVTPSVSVVSSQSEHDEAERTLLQV